MWNYMSSLSPQTYSPTTPPRTEHALKYNVTTVNKVMWVHRTFMVLDQIMVQTSRMVN